MAVESLVDANIILRYLLRDDPTFQKRADAILDKSPADSLIILDPVVAEVVYVMRNKGYVRNQIVTGLAYVLDRSAVSQGGLDSLRRTLRLYEAHPKLDFVDCYLIARALSSGRGVQSFDVPLQKTLKSLR